MTRKVLSLAALAETPDPIDITALTGGPSAPKGYDGSDFALFFESASGDRRKAFGGNQINWTPFAGPDGKVPVWSHFRSGAAKTIKYLKSDTQGFDAFSMPDVVETINAGGGWGQDADADKWLLGAGIQTSFTVTKQRHRHFVCMLQLWGGVYTVTAEFDDGSITPPTPLVIDGRTGYTWYNRWFEVHACAVNDTGVTIKITRTGTDNNVGMGLVPQACYLSPDVLRPKPHAFAAWSMARRQGT